MKLQLTHVLEEVRQLTEGGDVLRARRRVDEVDCTLPCGGHLAPAAGSEEGTGKDAEEDPGTVRHEQSVQRDDARGDQGALLATLVVQLLEGASDSWQAGDDGGRDDGVGEAEVDGYVPPEDLKTPGNGMVSKGDAEPDCVRRLDCKT